MKKVTAFILFFMMAFSLCACGKDESPAEKNSIPDSKTLLTNIWNTYTEDEKFSIIGGDFTEANNQVDTPGKFNITDVNALDSSLAFPVTSISEIDDAASMIHMMNGNTFTCGAFRMKGNNHADMLAADISQNIRNRQWVCGFPDKYVVAVIEPYMVAMFGNEALIDTFKNKMISVYPDVKILYDEFIG